MVPHCMTVLNLLLTQTSLILVYGGYLSSILQHTNTYGPDKQLDKCSNAWLEKWLSDLNGQLSIYYKCLILTWTCSSHAKSTGALMWNAAPDKMTVWNTAHNTFFLKNKQVKMQHMQSLRHSWNTSRQKYLSLFPCNSKLLSMNQYVLLSFILYSHSCTRWNSNEMSLVQELQFHYAESTLYTSAIHLFYNACWACPIYSVQHPCTCLQACIEFTCSHEWGKTLVMKANNRTYSYSKPSL